MISSEDHGVLPRAKPADAPPRADEEASELLARTARHDREALGALYDRTASLLHGLALRILGDRAAAEDVTIEVYLQVWRQASTYDPARGRPLAWLLTLTRTRALDRLRASHPGRVEPLRVARAVASIAPGPEEQAVAGERRRLVERALARLAPAQRQAVELAYFRGLSQREIAAELGEPLGTVKTRIRLGLMRLREALAGAGEELL
jgi:RNA polymerase sigma-70 factor (ECF subfamily)